MAKSPRKQLGGRMSRVPLTDVQPNATHMVQKVTPITQSAVQESENWTRTKLSVHMKHTRIGAPLKGPRCSSTRVDAQTEGSRKSDIVDSTNTKINKSSGRGNRTGHMEHKNDNIRPVIQERQHGRSSTESAENQVSHEKQSIAGRDRLGGSPGATSGSSLRPLVTPTKRGARKAPGTPGSSRALRSHTKAIKFADLGPSQAKSDCVIDRVEDADKIGEQVEDIETGDHCFSRSIFESEGFSMVSVSSLPTMYESSVIPNVCSPTAENTGGLGKIQTHQKQTPSIDPSPTIPPPPRHQPSERPNLMTSVSIPNKTSNQQKETPRMVRAVKAGMALQGVICPDSQHRDPIASKGNTDGHVIPSTENNKVSEVSKQSGNGIKRNFKSGFILGDKLHSTFLENGDEALISTPQVEDDVFREGQGFRPKSPARNGRDVYELDMPADQVVTYPELPLEALSDQPVKSGKIGSSAVVDSSVGVSSTHMARISRNTEDADSSNQTSEVPSKLSITKELDSLLFPESQPSTKGEGQQEQTRETNARRRPGKKKGEDKDIWQLEAEVGRQPKRRAINTKKHVRLVSPRQESDEMWGVEVERNVHPRPGSTGTIPRRKISQGLMPSTRKLMEDGFSDLAQKRQEDRSFEVPYSLKENTALDSSIDKMGRKETGGVSANAVFEQQKEEEIHEVMLNEEEPPPMNMEDEEPIGFSTQKEDDVVDDLNTIQNKPLATLPTETSVQKNIPPVKPLSRQPTKNNNMRRKPSKRKTVIISPTAIMRPPYRIRVPRPLSSFITSSGHRFYHHQRRYSKHYQPSLKIRTTSTGERIWTDGHYIHLKRLYKLTDPTTRAVLFTPTPTTPTTGPTITITTAATSTTNRIKDSILSWFFPTTSTSTTTSTGNTNTSILNKLISLPNPINRAFYIHHAELETIKRFLEDVRRANRHVAEGDDDAALWGEEYVAGRLLRLRVGEERRLEVVRREGRRG